MGIKYSDLFAAVEDGNLAEVLSDYLHAEEDELTFLELEDRHADNVGFKVVRIRPCQNGTTIADVTCSYDEMMPTNCCDISLPTACEATLKVTIDPVANDVRIEVLDQYDSESFPGSDGY